MRSTPQCLICRYFDIKGLGEPIRLALEIGGIKYEDIRVKFSEWPEMKPSTPYGSLPLLEVGGKVYAQSEPILRFIGKKAGLYPADDLLALKVDEMMAATHDAIVAVSASVREKDEAKKAEMRKVPMCVCVCVCVCMCVLCVCVCVCVCDLREPGVVQKRRKGRCNNVPGR